MKYGYVRVSTTTQNIDRQMEEVHKFGLTDEFIYIDMNEACESLNVGVATSIILYELDK